ncbi:putative membrane protein [Apostasia shenzhenica]|uniref:Putative membrane protein n=1 Tax=Apostasia shenzhenica TaxID=1088818 RepID=A0A2I0A254_9ASPA|nr:putative membrane protein [Apostasia shenzhenica]
MPRRFNREIHQHQKEIIPEEKLVTRMIIPSCARRSITREQDKLKGLLIVFTSSSSAGSASLLAVLLLGVFDLNFSKKRGCFGEFDAGIEELSVLLCPIVCLIMTIGNSAIILGLWPAHAFWTFYSVARAKQLGPVLKLAISTAIIPVLLVLWLWIGMLGSILIGAGYGFLMPVMATFDAVGEGKENEFIHCILDGTWSTVKGSCTVVRDLKDVCFHSYFSIMDDIRLQDAPNGKVYEIRLSYIPGAILAGVLGTLVDPPVITMIALFKSPYMLFKGWNRLFHDLIGREGPFLETVCVPFAGLAIMLWPVAVAGAVLASVISSLFLGGYAAVVAYQESSMRMGLAYVISALSMFDEYSNDVLDLPEGSCFPRCQYQKNQPSRTSSFSRPPSFNHARQDAKIPSRTVSFKNTIADVKSLKLLEHLFAECKLHGERLVAEGFISPKDIREFKSGKSGSSIISVGWPAYCILQALFRSAKANLECLLLSDNTVLMTTSRPKDTFFDYFFDPLMIMKEQIKVVNFTQDEEDYLCRLVLLLGDQERLSRLTGESQPQNEQRRAEINAIARRLQGITKSISRYPTVRRRFEELLDSFSKELERKMGGSEPIHGIRPSRSILRTFSHTSFGIKASTCEREEAQQTAQQL